MTFQIKAPETFPIMMTLVGQGREQVFKAVGRHMGRKRYLALLDSIGKGEISEADGILQLLASWDADTDLSAASLELLEDEQPGMQWAIINGYGASLAVARKGN